MHHLSNEELVKMAGETVIGTTSGLKSQQAQAELSRRLIESNLELKKSLDSSTDMTKTFNNAMFNLTIILTFLAIIQIYASTIGTQMHWVWKIILYVAPLVVVYTVFKEKTKLF